MHDTVNLSIEHLPLQERNRFSEAIEQLVRDGFKPQSAATGNKSWEHPTDGLDTGAGFRIADSFTFFVRQYRGAFDVGVLRTKNGRVTTTSLKEILITSAPSSPFEPEFTPGQPGAARHPVGMF